MWKERARVLVQKLDPAHLQAEGIKSHADDKSQNKDNGVCLCKSGEPRIYKKKNRGYDVGPGVEAKLRAQNTTKPAHVGKEEQDQLLFFCHFAYS